MLTIQQMLRMGSAVLGHKFFGLSRPLNVMLAVTDRCNSRCRYCNIPGRGHPDATTDQLLKLIDEMAAAGAVRLGLWGGEPLLRDDIGKLVDHAKSRGLYVTMDTNGLLWPERAAELRALDHVIFGLDGRPENHDANRGAGNQEKVLRAIESAAATPGLSAWTITVLNRRNLEDIDYLLDLAERLKFRCTFQILHHNEELGRNHGELMPANEEYRAAIRRLLRRKREGARIGSSERYLRYLLAWPDYRTATRAGRHLGLSCKAGKLYCNIDADGRVFACSLLIGKAEAANAIQSGFKAAFQAIPPLPCQACTAGCFTEYNYIYGLDPLCILDWMRAMRR